MSPAERSGGPRPLAPPALGRPLGMYSHGVVAPGGELVIVAGQIGIGAGGQVAGPDVGTQTKQALENVRAVVEAAGCRMRHIVRLQTFLTRADDIPGFMQARTEVFPRYFPDGVYPPNTLLVVNRLVRPEFVVEIEAMAVRPVPSLARRGGAQSTNGRARKAPSRQGRPRKVRR